MSVTERLKSSESDFVVFSSNLCMYCHKAKDLLASKGLSFDEHNVGEEPGLQDEVIEMTGHKTVPAIWDVRGAEPVFVGGFDNLEASL